MKGLKIFLKALEKVLNLENNTLYPLTTTLQNTKFPAYTSIKGQVWMDKKLLVEDSVTINTSKVSVEEAKETLSISIIEKLLHLYGIQSI